MEPNKAEGKRSLKQMEEDEEDKEDEDVEFGDEEKKKKKLLGKMGSSDVAGSSPMISCQVENCTADMAYSKRYHRRHKVCENHAKASIVLVAGIQQRFCQQCSRFHALMEFDDNKKSCRRRLAGHNERRRKSYPYYQGEGSN